MSTSPTFAIPPDYQRGIRFGAIWTLVISPYLILYFLAIVLAGTASGDAETIDQTLVQAGTMPLTFAATVLGDGLFHVLFMVTVVTLFAALRVAWPVRASLILLCGAWQMILALTKVISTVLIFTELGAAYMGGDAAAQTAILPVANAAYQLWQALQWMDSLGVLAIWLLVALLPAATGLPRAVRWLGWIMAAAILAPDPAFLLVVLLSPVWLFPLGRWLLWLATTTAPLV
jgi:hypothetical protein